ncbi:hypothetical protein POM88_040011 [Heracleum sosnowskyi]|uniref:FAD-binding domain-containing protein n=1 Tax=Heracleum sosnowskyi TaxID=360622 RepID=A0AAD8HE69_9APIA|nr:hypothetical protein POM88_040011 [Heracleum sosnowskyi]
MKGEKDLQKLVSVHFMSKQLEVYLINTRPAMLFFIFNDESIGVLVVHDLMEGEFVLQKYLLHDNCLIVSDDAAHQFPPAGGCGMNIGTQHVHNLAWKLASQQS